MNILFIAKYTKYDKRIDSSKTLPDARSISSTGVVVRLSIISISISIIAVEEYVQVLDMLKYSNEARSI